MQQVTWIIMLIIIAICRSVLSKSQRHFCVASDIEIIDLFIVATTRSRSSTSRYNGYSTVLLYMYSSIRICEW